MKEFAPELLTGAAKRQIPTVGHTDKQFFSQMLLATNASGEDGEECNAHEFLYSLTDDHRAKWLVVWNEL